MSIDLQRNWKLLLLMKLHSIGAPYNLKSVIVSNADISGVVLCMLSL